MTGSSSSWSSVSTRGWCICQTSPSYFGLPESITRWPKLNLSRMKGWLNQIGPQVAGRATDRDAEDAAAGTGIAEVDVLDNASDRLQLALFKLVDCPFVA